MVVSLIMMGLSSLLIAVLPGYATLGLAAPCLLILLRCVQGFSLGGESTAAQLMAMEYAPPGRRAPWPLMLLAMVLTLVADYVEFGVLAAIFAEPYPKQSRYSGHASAYTFTNLGL